MTYFRSETTLGMPQIKSCQNATGFRSVPLLTQYTSRWCKKVRQVPFVSHGIVVLLNICIVCTAVCNVQISVLYLIGYCRLRAWNQTPCTATSFSKRLESALFLAVALDRKKEHIISGQCQHRYFSVCFRSVFWPYVLNGD